MISISCTQPMMPEVEGVDWSWRRCFEFEYRELKLDAPKMFLNFMRRSYRRRHRMEEHTTQHDDDHSALHIAMLLSRFGFHPSIPTRRPSRRRHRHCIIFILEWDVVGFWRYEHRRVLRTGGSFRKSLKICCRNDFDR